MKKHSRIVLMTKEDIINVIRNSLPTLKEEYGVKRIGVFGSAATGHLDDTSAIDLVVEFERPIGFRFLDLAEDLERLPGRKVDILTPAGMNSIRVPSVAENIRENAVYV
jgi:predicted nucleotidyltransferase